MNNITNDIVYIGINDYTTDLFESHYPIPNGVTYNSYVILDEKTMVVATMAEGFAEEWMDKVREALNGRNPDYLLIQHMEPDHSAALDRFMKAYPETTVVASKPAINMMVNYFGTDYAGRNLIIKDGDTLCLGKHELVFVGAPMVHWPEVMMAYDKEDKVLFSADAFGRFGAPLDHSLDGASAEYEAEEWLTEARRYYIGIVGKQGDSVKKAFAKIAELDNLETRIICALHGPVLTHDLTKYFDVYMKWATYTPEEEGVAICYSSVYGHTKEAVQMLAATLKELYKGIGHCSSHAVPPVEVFDLARCDLSAAVAAAFRYSKVVLATTTYYNDIFPCMKDFINHLKYSAFQNRKVALIENGSWAPKAAAGMKALLEECPGIEYCNTSVSIKSAMTDANKEQVLALAKELIGH